MKHITRSIAFIHIMAFLGLLGLAGALLFDKEILYFFMGLSFAGSICGAFERVIYFIKSKGN